MLVYISVCVVDLLHAYLWHCIRKVGYGEDSIFKKSSADVQLHLWKLQIWTHGFIIFSSFSYTLKNKVDQNIYGRKIGWPTI